MSFLESLASLLPPPHYLTRPSVGVDISDTSLKYVLLKPAAGKDYAFDLDKYGTLSIPEGVMRDGLVQDVGGLVKVLQKVKRLTKTSHVRLSLPTKRAFVFETEVRDDVLGKELRGELDIKFKDGLPVDSKSMYFDYDISPTPFEENVWTVSVAAYPKKVADSYYEVCKKAGVKPLSFETESQAAARAVIPKEERGTYMVVDFGEKRTRIGVVSRGHIASVAVVDIGGRDLSEAIRDSLGDISESDISIMKNTEGLIKNEEDSPIYEAIIDTVDVWEQKLSEVVTVWNNRNSDTLDRYIEKIFLCGGSSNLNGLPEYLSSKIKIDTLRGNVWSNTFSLDYFVPQIGRADSYGYATAIGLSLSSYLE